MRWVLLWLKCYKIIIDYYYHSCRNYILVMYTGQIFLRNSYPFLIRVKLAPVSSGLLLCDE